MDIAIEEKKSTEVKRNGFPIKQETRTPIFEAWLNQTPWDLKDFTLHSLTLLPNDLLQIGFEIAQRPMSLFIFGEYGSGKTSFAYATVREMLKYHPHIFARAFSSKKLDSLLYAANQKGKDYEYFEIENLSSVDVLLIDDLDKIHPSEQFRSNFFEILNARMQNKKITIITSNSSIKDLGSLVDGSIVSRLNDNRFWKIVRFPKKDLRRGDIISF